MIGRKSGASDTGLPHWDAEGAKGSTFRVQGTSKTPGRERGGIRRTNRVRGTFIHRTQKGQDKMDQPRPGLNHSPDAEGAHVS